MGDKEELWHRATVNEEVPMAVGPGWERPVGRLALLKESRMDRLALWELREKGQSGKASWKRGHLSMGVPERSTSIGAERSEMAREESLSLDLQRGTVYLVSACCGPGLGGCRGSNVVPALRQSMGWLERQVQRQLALVLGWKEAEHPNWLVRGRCLEPMKEGSPGSNRSLCKSPKVRHDHLTHVYATWVQALC